MKSKISVVLPILLVTSLGVQAQDNASFQSALPAEAKKSVLIQEDSRKNPAASVSSTEQARATGKSGRKLRFLEATRHAVENVIISEQEPALRDSDYVASNELCTFNRAAYTYTCR
jgi:hypothetical protein